MREFHPEDKVHARQLYTLLNRHLLEWMGSYQGFDHITRDQVKGNLNLDDAALDMAIAVIKQWSFAVKQPSITSVILREDNVLHVHDFGYMLSKYEGLQSIGILGLIDHRGKEVGNGRILTIEPYPAVSGMGMWEICYNAEEQSDFAWLGQHFKLLL